ncbi:MAG: hypothetical protein JNL81_06465 [Hyphomonadaceae bacterium]|nr:hypothetical protein [Hyphomonadaceae bacterium]
MMQSEVAAKLAVDGAVAAIGGTVKGALGLTPRIISKQEKSDLGIAEDGEALFYQVGDGGVFFHSNGVLTTIWCAEGDNDKSIDVLDAAVQRAHPDAKRVKDEPHPTEPGLRLRTYDINLQKNNLAVVDAVYSSGASHNSQFMIRVTAMARQN